MTEGLFFSLYYIANQENSTTEGINKATELTSGRGAFRVGSLVQGPF